MAMPRYDYVPNYNMKAMMQLLPRYVSIANKRIRRLRELNTTNFPLRIATNTLGARQGQTEEDFLFRYNKKMSFSEQEKTMKAVVRFLNSQTSTVSGYKKWRQASLNSDFRSFLDSLSDSDYDFFVSIFKSESSSKIFELLKDSDAVQKIFMSVWQRKDFSIDKLDDALQMLSETKDKFALEKFAEFFNLDIQELYNTR